MLLEREGFKAVLAPNGRSGLDHAAIGRPDLILVDIRLPDISGVEICKRMRASGVGTPIIVLSAVGEEIDKVLLLEIGADDYVVKPFGARELLARIRAVLRRMGPEAAARADFFRCRSQPGTARGDEEGTGSPIHARRVQSADILSPQSGPAVVARPDF